MAISMSVSNLPKEISLVSVVDSAINWEKSEFEDTFIDEQGNELKGIDAKKAHYKKSYNVDKLVFVADELPTVFVFKNPNRFENGSKITDIIVQCSGMMQKKEPVISDIHKRIWNLLFVGYYEGVLQSSDNVVNLLQKPFSNGNITEQFLQAMYANDILDELSNALQSLKKTK